MPAENITRAIKKGTGELEGVNYEEIRYEGYGISGVAIIIDCLTDNKQNIEVMMYIAIGLIGTGLWIAYEIYTAPWYDEDTNTFYKKRKK